MKKVIGMAMVALGIVGLIQMMLGLPSLWIGIGCLACGACLTLWPETKGNKSHE